MAIQYDSEIYPILSPSAAPDNGDQEMGSIILEGSTYYLFTHSWHNDGKYKIGVATSSSPYGPFVKSANNPILSDVVSVACPKVIKVGAQYWMLYIKSPNAYYLAQPTDPNDLTKAWAEVAGPLLADFGYPGGIIWDGAQFVVHACYPIDANDEGPIALATAPAIDGVWTKYAGNPVIDYGAAGSWNALGHPESGFVLDGGVYKGLLSGAQAIVPPRNNRLGWAQSADGITWSIGAAALLTPESLGYRYLSEPFTLVYTDPADGIKKYLCYVTVSPSQSLPAPDRYEHIGLYIFSNHFEQVSQLHWVGISTDTKPTGVPAGSRCHELDTKREYITTDGSTWTVWRTNYD